MNTTAFLLAGINTLLVILLAADRWVHRVTGSAPLEAQITELRTQMTDMRKLITEGNARSSKKATELTVYLEERRTDVEGLRALVNQLEGQLSILRGRRRL